MHLVRESIFEKVIT